MISQNQVAQLSKEFKIHESIVVREFVQISFLKELYAESFSKNVFFKGGTAIRLLYGGKRFSEDLDFSVLQKKKIFERNIISLFKKLTNQYPYLFKQRKTITGKTFLLTAQVPFIKNAIFVKLDFSMREAVVEPENIILETSYPVIVQSFIHALSKNEIFAEKIRAIMTREKHRDLYDLWILQELGAVFDLELIEKKLEYYGEKLDLVALSRRLEIFSKQGFVRDLRPFVPISEKEQLGSLFEYVVVYLKKSLGKLS